MQMTKDDTILHLWDVVGNNISVWG